jgi:hypothetical protein
MAYIHIRYSRVYPSEARARWVWTSEIPKIGDLQVGPQKIKILWKMTVTIPVKFQWFVDAISRNKTDLRWFLQKNIVTSSSGPNSYMRNYVQCICRIYEILCNVLRYSQYVDCLASNDTMIDELGRIWKETVLAWGTVTALCTRVLLHGVRVS